MPSKAHIWDENAAINPYAVFNEGWPTVAPELRPYLNRRLTDQGRNHDRVLTAGHIRRIDHLLPADGTVRYALDDRGQVYFAFAREGVEVGYNPLQVSDRAIDALRQRFGEPSAYPLRFSKGKLTPPDVAADQTNVAVATGEGIEFIPITSTMREMVVPQPKSELAAAKPAPAAVPAPAPSFHSQAAQIQLITAITSAARAGNTHAVQAVEAYLNGHAGDGMLSEGEGVALANRLQEQAPAAQAKLAVLVDQLKEAGVKIATATAMHPAPASAEPRQR